MQPEPAGADLELLRRHAPRLIFDSMEALRPTQVDAYLEGSVAWDAQEREVAKPGTAIGADRGRRDWVLNPLPDVAPDNQRGQRWAELRSNELLTRYEAHQDPAAQGTCYGRETSSGGAIFLQYWFFYVDNPCVLAPGRHDGDWEFVQIRLTERDHPPTHITVAQHGAPETRRLSPGTEHPEVFVASGSHASYLTGGSQPRLPIADVSDAGRAPEKGLVVEPIPGAGWPYWRGRWGTDKGLGTWLAIALHWPRTPVYLRWLNRLGAVDSPPSPRWQHISWTAPLTFQTQGAAHRFTRVAWRGLLRWGGRLTAPRRAPVVQVERDGQRATSIRATARGWGLRRTTRVAVALEDAATGRVLAVHTIRAGRPKRMFELASTGQIRWRAAGYNPLRQRGDVSEPAALEGSG